MENTRETSLKIVDIHVDALIPYEDNTNEMDDKTFNRLAEEIAEVGFIDPLQVIPREDGKFRIMGGHHRWKAAMTLGMEYIPCNVLTDEKWADNDLYELVSFRLNAIKGRVNSEKFIKVYEKMSAKFGEEQIQNIFAVTDDDVWNKLTSSVRKALSDGGVPKEMIDKFKEAEKSMKTVDDLARVLNSLFTEYGDTVPFNFMFFNFGKNDHIMVQSNKKTFNAMKGVADHAAKNKTDINEVLEPAMKQLQAGLPETEAPKATSEPVAVATQ